MTPNLTKKSEKMQKNFSHFYNILGYKFLQKWEKSVFFPPADGIPY